MADKTMSRYEQAIRDYFEAGGLMLIPRSGSGLSPWQLQLIANLSEALVYAFG
jgi:hypothetical protein